MLTLIKGAECYCPHYIGKNDILTVNDKIFKIQKNIDNSVLIDKIINCDGLLAFPGIIDQHVHIIGGGGEQGFVSRITEIDIHEILLAGVTTVVGLLGFDGYTRSLYDLLAKARALEIQGITSYIYTGSYTLPPVTLTDNATTDIVLIDKIIGAGEIAISDHRSSQPSLSELLKLASEIHTGGLISGKAGVIHMHIGDGKFGLNPLLEVIDRSDLPYKEFIPTHINRNEALFKQGTEYCIAGGYIDLTAGESNGIAIPDAISNLIDKGSDFSRITVSSDANGSIPSGGTGKMKTLYDDIIRCIKNAGIKPEIIFRLITENVAKVLNIYPKKGTLSEGSDADILITDNNYNIKKLLCMGKLLVDDGCVRVNII
jgi:beta-aspartyl-dipeptidase (metallo-type)